MKCMCLRKCPKFLGCVLTLLMEADVIALTAGRVTYTRGDRGDLRTGRQDSGTLGSLLREPWVEVMGKRQQEGLRGALQDTRRKVGRCGRGSRWHLSFCFRDERRGGDKCKCERISVQLQGVWGHLHKYCLQKAISGSFTCNKVAICTFSGTISLPMCTI